MSERKRNSKHARPDDHTGEHENSPEKFYGGNDHRALGRIVNFLLVDKLDHMLDKTLWIRIKHHLPFSPPRFFKDSFDFVRHSSGPDQNLSPLFYLRPKNLGGQISLKER